MSTKPSKSLSFYQNIDESDASSDEIQAEDRRNKSVIDESNHIGGHEESKKVVDHKVAEPIESDHENEASSTSSCSCEDHSSVGDENPHGDLDYGEDSISGSPSNAIQEEDDVLGTTATQKKVAGARSLGFSGKAQSSSKDSMDVAGNKDQNLSPNEESGSPLPERPTKIRSFINFDREPDDDTEIKKTSSGKHKKTSSKDRSHKSYEGLLKYFFKDACFFQIKSINYENVEISKRMGIWSTPVQNEVRLNMAFREHRNVILIFSVQQSGAFQGFARMISEAKPTAKPPPWVLPERLNKASLGGVFKVEWLCKNELPFHEVRTLNNPFNNNKPVKVARDGQQVEPKIGKKLCLMFPQESREDLLLSIDTLKRQTRHKKQMMQKADSYYPMNNLYMHPQPPPLINNKLDFIGVASTSHPSYTEHFQPPIKQSNNFRWGSLTARRRGFEHAGQPNLFDRPGAQTSNYSGPFHRSHLNYNNHQHQYAHYALPQDRNFVSLPEEVLPAAYQSHPYGSGPGSYNSYPNLRMDNRAMHSSPPHRYHPYQRTRR